MDETPTNRRWLIVLLIAALAVRLGWGLSRSEELPADLPDQREYLAIARNLLAGEGLKFFDERFGAEVFAFRSPGYPLLIAGLGASVRVVRAGQALIDTSTVLAIFLLARRWLSDRQALFAAALVAVNPFLIFLSSLILSETLFTAMLAWGMCCLAYGWENERQGAKAAKQQEKEVETSASSGWRPWRLGVHWVLLGMLILSAAALVRSSAIPLATMLAVAAGWGSWRRAIALAGLGATFTFLVLLPWAYRNHRVLDHWIWTTTNGGHTLYDGFKPTADGSSDLSELRDWKLLRLMSEVTRDRFLGDEARRMMDEDVGRSVRLAGRKIARTWSPVPLSSEYGSSRNMIVGLAYSLPLFTLAFVGLVRSGLPVPAKVFCLLPAIYFTGVHALSIGSLRYRIPIEPPMAVVAAWAGKRRATSDERRVGKHEAMIDKR